MTCFIDPQLSRTLAQAAILAACYHMRSSVGWEVAFVSMAGILFWARQMWSARRPAISSQQRAIAFRPPWPVVCVAAAFVLLTAYRHHAYNPRYFQDMGGRTIWHNALMGLGSNPYLNGRNYEYRWHIQHIQGGRPTKR